MTFDYFNTINSINSTIYVFLSNSYRIKLGTWYNTSQTPYSSATVQDTTNNHDINVNLFRIESTFFLGGGSNDSGGPGLRASTIPEHGLKPFRRLKYSCSNSNCFYPISGVQC